MTMYYRLLLIIAILQAFSWQITECRGRTNNEIDLNNVQSSVLLSSLNRPINKPLNLINHLNYREEDSHHHERRRSRRSEKEIIKRNLAERYPSDPQSNKTLDEALKFLEENNLKSIEISRLSNIASWNYDSNLTEANKEKMLEQSLKDAKFKLDTWSEAKSFAWKKFNDTRIKRWFKSLTAFNNLAVGEAKYKELNLIEADLVDIYSKAKICSYKSKSDCNLELEPDLALLMKESRDYDELKHVWIQWRNATGKKMRSKYLRYVELMNEMANKNGFNDAGEVWREDFEIENGNFQEQMEAQMKKIQDLYQLLHAYVRKRLRQTYGPEKITSDGPIPAHILGNMWAQDWSNSNLDILLPFPKRSKTDLSQNLKNKNLTPVGIFKIGESFFQSLGMQKLPDEFWQNSILEKPKNVQLVCHASAWDFDSKDVRIKQCTRIEHEDFVTAHHELGHIYYYLLYANQPFVFKNGANSGFHEAIGDCLALSVQSPKHLKTIGLLSSDETTDNSTATNEAKEEEELNFLMQMALQKISFLPFGYLIDKYRWNVFNKKISEDKLNSEWWRLRAELQGVCPPVLRTENDFDPGAKYHVPASVPYLRYFVSHILQFQFHKYLCDAAGHKGRLNQCDIYGSKEAGKRFSAMLSLGSSVPWPEALKVISNNTEDKMNAEAVLEYFSPLIDWLKKQLTNEDVIGWKITNANVCPNH